jgi:hypothetical protein
MSQPKITLIGGPTALIESADFGCSPIRRSTLPASVACCM